MQARFKPIAPRIQEADERKLRPDDVDMAEVQPVNPDLPLTEPTPLPKEMDMDRSGYFPSKFRILPVISASIDTGYAWWRNTCHVFRRQKVTVPIYSASVEDHQ